MKVTNNSLEYLNLIKTIEKAPEQSDRVPDSIAPAPDLNPTGEAQSQNNQNQPAKSEAAKKSSAAQDSFLRGMLELKYEKDKSGSQADESTGTQGSDADNAQAEQATGNPTERITDRKENNPQESRSRYEGGNEEITQKGKKVGSVYVDGSSGGDLPVSGGGKGTGSVSSEGGGGGESGGGGGIAAGSGPITPEQRAKYEEAMGKQGPESAKSKIDEINSRVPTNGFEQRDANVNKAFQDINPFNRMQDPTQSSDSGPGSSDRGGKYGGKGMIGDAFGETVALAGGAKEAAAAVEFAKAYTWVAGGATTRAAALAGVGGFGAAFLAGAEAGHLVDLAYTAVNGQSLGEDYADMVAKPKIAQQEAEQKKATEKAIAEQKKKAEEEAAAKKAEEEKKAAEEKKKKEEEEKKKAEKNKKKEGTDYDQESYNQRTRQKIDGKTGFDFTSNLPKAPKTSGDVDPAEEGTADIDTSGKLGKKSTDWISQPGDEGTTDVGASGNVSMGGDVDFEDRSGWAGREMHEDPADVMNGAPYNDEPLPPAANQSTEESSEESDKSLTAQLLKNLRIKI